MNETSVPATVRKNMLISMAESLVAGLVTAVTLAVVVMLLP